MLKKKASDVELKLSEYVYHLAMNRTLKTQSKQFRQELRGLLGCANNLNQLAKTANKYGLLSEGDIDKLKKTVELIYNTITETI